MSPAFGPPPAVTPNAAPAATTVAVSTAAPPRGWGRYVVRSGDTVADLAVRFHTTPQALAARNHLRDGGRIIRPGQSLLVPRATPHRQTARPARVTVIRVRAGDTLSGLAQRHRTTVAALRKLNHLRSSVIYSGTRLRVPGIARAASAPRRTAVRAVYRVRPGDTLSDIALRTRTPLATLLRVNRLSGREHIHPGQRLRVRGTSGPAQPARTASTAYRVRPGDTLSGIAARHGISLARLVKHSGLSASRAIHPGQVIPIPRTTRKATSANTFAGRTYPDRIVRAAERNRAILARRQVPSRAETRALIVRTARRHGVDPKLALAVAWQESGWNQRQVSVANAIGTMQVIPSSGEWASSLVGRRLDLLDTRDNITAGVVILRALTRSADSSSQAIAGYYQGLYSVRTHGMYADTKRYVAAVRAHRARM